MHYNQIPKVLWSRVQGCLRVRVLVQNSSSGKTHCPVVPKQDPSFNGIEVVFRVILVVLKLF